MYRTFGKRLLDLAVTIPALTVLSPLYVLVALLVHLKLGPPVLFRQQRPGLHGQPFTILKFRTMTDARDDQGNLLLDAERVTSFGQFLRSTSLDELPGLINVLKGEMSLVGPRPLKMEYLQLYTPVQMRRHEAMPGITGLAQVNGRNAMSWEDKFALDVWYVDHQSLGLDLKIIALTAWKVLKREGISEPGRVTSSDFMGTEKRGIVQKSNQAKIGVMSIPDRPGVASAICSALGDKGINKPLIVHTIDLNNLDNIVICVAREDLPRALLEVLNAVQETIGAAEMVYPIC